MSEELAGPEDFLLYQLEDGSTRIEVRLAGDTLWLSQAQMAELFQKDVRTVNEHLKTIFAEGELDPEATIRKFRIVRREGSREVTRQIEHYRLEAIIAVGYRVRSFRGTQFRQWATARLHEYLVKGFTMDDARLKQEGGGLYFDELLARIKDIRSSEKVFWRKVLEIYATSVDYDPSIEASRTFFAIVQNKMHWAAHGQTAAEVIDARADAQKPNMGLTAWAGGRPGKGDAVVAKNYLSLDEMDALNRIVTAYLDFAEVQAINRRPMYMTDWIAKLDDYLRLSERDVLTHAGRVTHEAAVSRAESEYEKFRSREAESISAAERDFERFVDETKKLPEQNPPKEKHGDKP